MSRAARVLYGLLCGLCAVFGAQAAQRTVIDMSGREVHVPTQVARIGCLEVLCYEKLFLLGASDRIAMMIHTNAPWMHVTNPALDRIQQLSSDPDTEELLRQHVDVVFRTFGYPDPRKIDMLAALGIPVVVSQTMGTESFDSIDAFVSSRDRMLRVFAQVLGPEYAARAEEWCAYHDRMVAMVRARTEHLRSEQRVKVFHIRGPTATRTSGVNSQITWYGLIAGADMVVRRARLADRGDLSIEDILRWDPDVINVGRFYPADLVTKDPRWAHVSAVRNGRVHELPEGVFYWDGSTEGVLLMLYLAKELHPDLFPDLDLKKEFRDYYARFYRYRLSDRELELMLAGKGPDGRRANSMNN